LPSALAPITWPASALYRGAIALRNRRYDRPGAAHHVAVPVVSVGNITAGGSGKTPFVRWIAADLLARGIRPAIAMRGYGARPGAPADEAEEYRDLLPDVPVIEDPDRVAAVRAFLAEGDRADCVLLDDGFQHRRLHRDLDIVLVDGTRAGLDDRMLPAGYLREPAASLRRADAVVVTRVAAPDPVLARTIAQHHGRLPLAWCDHVWRGVRCADAAGERTVGLETLVGKLLLTVLGVGHPRAVRTQLARAGAEIVRDLPARDHARYDAAWIDRIRTEARALDAVLVTYKDWVKLRDLIDFADWSVPILVPIVEIEPRAGGDALLELVHRVVRGARAGASAGAEPGADSTVHHA
jgi:tetraacyldisaccharide 4'-kinase